MSKPETKNITKVIETNLCILCGTCQGICETGAIDIKFENGYKLYLDENKCVNCGMCINVCPGLHITNYVKKFDNIKENYYIGAYYNVFRGYTTHFQRRYNSSSGGLVTETLLYLFENKIIDAAIITSFSNSFSLKPEGIIAKNKNDILGSSGSKYSPVPLNLLLKNIDINKKYAYVGLPCHIQGLDLFFKSKKIDISKNIIKLGLFCSRTNSFKATEYLLKYNKVFVNDIRSIRYRGNGHPGFFCAEDNSGKQKNIYHLDETYWGVLFKKHFVPYRCWLCPDKSSFYSDISFGDDWTRSLTNDIVGANNLIVRTDKGKKILQEMELDKRIVLENLEIDFLLKSQSLYYKMNVLKRKMISGFFGCSLPNYINFNFKKEKLSYISELKMFIRIKLQDSFLIRLLIPMDIFFYRRRRNFNNILKIFRLMTNLKLVVIKALFLLKNSAKTIQEKLGKIFKSYDNINNSPVEIPNNIAIQKNINNKKTPFRIVTIGGYGYNDVGDEAMPRAIISNLKKCFNNNINVVMLSPFPKFTTDYHGNLSYPDIIFNYNNDDIASLNAERNSYLRLANIYSKNKFKGFLLSVFSFRMSFYKILCVIENCDCLLNVGGGNLNSIMRKELYKRTTLHMTAKILGKKVYISGQTIGPFYNDNDRCIALESLRNVDILTFRDKDNSHQLVKEIGITKSLMYNAGDDAFSLETIGKVKGLELIKSDSSTEWFNLNSKYTWAINLKASLKMFKGAGRSLDLTKEIDLLVEISLFILNNYNSRILLVSTDYCDEVDDRIVLNEVYRKIPDNLKCRVNLLRQIYNDYQLKGIISCCDFALGARYHFSVFALASHIPTIGIASGEYQRTKLKGILGLLDLNDYYIPDDMEFASIQKIGNIINKMVKNEKLIKEKLKLNVPALMGKSVSIVDHIYNDFISKDKG